MIDLGYILWRRARPFIAVVAALLALLAVLYYPRTTAVMAIVGAALLFVASFAYLFAYGGNGKAK